MFPVGVSLLSPAASASAPAAGPPFVVSGPPFVVSGPPFVVSGPPFVVSPADYTAALSAVDMHMTWTKQVSEQLEPSIIVCPLTYTTVMCRRRPR